MGSRGIKETKSGKLLRGRTEIGNSNRSAGPISQLSSHLSSDDSIVLNLETVGDIILWQLVL